MTGHVECGDDVLVGYDCQARLPNGAIDGAKEAIAQGYLTGRD